MPMIMKNCTFQKGLFKKMEAYAEKYDCPVTELVRESVRNHLSNHNIEDKTDEI